jgi:uncharacterized protein involved in exopolysaccharide biosynthesis
MNLLRPIVKSDLRVFGLVFSIIILVAVIHALWLPRIYEASGTVKFRSSDDEASHHSGSGMEDRDAMRVELKSSELIHRVIARFTDADRVRFLAHHDRSQEPSESVLIEQLIREKQRVSFHGLERALLIQYQHTDRLIAARVVNLLIDEVITYQVRMKIDQAMKAVEELKLRAEAQERRVRELTAEMVGYREEIERTPEKPFEPDENYEALRRQQTDAEKIRDRLIQRMRDTTMVTRMDFPSWRPGRLAVAPDEDDYLVEPIVMRLSWGFTAAVVGGLLVVGVVNIFTRGRELADNQKEAA